MGYKGTDEFIYYIEYYIEKSVLKSMEYDPPLACARGHL
jgi:hypothetical protein